MIWKNMKELPTIWKVSSRYRPLNIEKQGGPSWFLRRKIRVYKWYLIWKSSSSWVERYRNQLDWTIIDKVIIKIFLFHLVFYPYLKKYMVYWEYSPKIASISSWKLFRLFFCTIDAIDIRREHLRKHVQEHGVNGTNFLLD